MFEPLKIRRTGFKVCFTLAATLLFLLLISAAASAAQLGHVYGDDDISVKDVLLVQKHILNISPLTEAQKPVANVNGDKYIDVKDLTMIMQKVLGIIDEFPILGAPALIAPVNNAFISGTSLNFQWSASPGAGQYQLEIIEAVGETIFKNPVLANVTSHTQSGFPNDVTEYKWRVRAGKEGVWGPWSGYRKLTNTVVPPAPALSLPADNATIAATAINFKWHASAGADKYQLEVIDAFDETVFKNPVLSDTTSYTQTGFPNDGTHYRWRVRAGNEAGWGPWSNDRNLINGSPAPWSLLTGSPGWSPRTGHTSVVHPDGTIILMGGFDGSRKNDVWHSYDGGETWSLIQGSAEWTPRNAHVSVVLSDGTIVLMGGWSTSGIKNDVWQSTNKGHSWTKVKADAEWSDRAGHAAVVLSDDTIVLLGGQDATSRKKDVWHSYDGGINWTAVNTNPGWGARAAHTAIVLSDDTIVLMGGNVFIGYKNDVWRSKNSGVSWTQMTSGAAWTPRAAHACVALSDDTIVLMGGFDGSRKNDVWRSVNEGQSWLLMIGEAEWSPRNYHNTVVLDNNSILLMGGRDTARKNDVWLWSK